MPLLATALQLHDVRDVEKHVTQALDETLRKWGATLNEHAREDAIQYLIVTAWRLSQRYDPQRSDQSFSTYLGRISRRRIVDWYRTTYRDARFNTDPLPRSLDEPHGELGGRTLGATLRGDEDVHAFSGPDASRWNPGEGHRPEVLHDPLTDRNPPAKRTARTPAAKEPADQPACVPWRRTYRFPERSAA